MLLSVKVQTSSKLLVTKDTMIFFLCLQSDSALTVVENNEGGGREGRDDDDDQEAITVDEDEGDLEVVQPTEEWQTLKPGNEHDLPVICRCQETSGLVLDILCVCVCAQARQCPEVPT